MVVGINGVGCTHLRGQLEFIGIDINRDDPARFRHRCALDDRQTHAAETIHRDGGARFNFRRVQYRADASRNSTAKQAGLIRAAPCR